MNGDLPYSSSSFGMLAYGAIFILAVPATFWIFKRYGCCTVDATWYVGPRYRRRILWQQRIGRTIVFLVAMSAGGRMARESASMLPLIGMTLVGLVLCRFYDPNVRLQLAGRRRGFFVLKGHSKSFYHEVKRIGSGFQSVGEEVSTVTAE